MSPERESVSSEPRGRLLQILLAGSLSACHPSTKAEPPTENEAYQLITAPSPTFDENGREIFNAERFEVLMAEAGFELKKPTNSAFPRHYSVDFNDKKWLITIHERDIQGDIRISYHPVDQLNNDGRSAYVSDPTLQGVIRKLARAMSN